MPRVCKALSTKSSYPSFTNSGLEGLRDIVQTSWLQKTQNKSKYLITIYNVLKLFCWTNGFHCNSPKITSLILSQFTTKDLISPLMNKEPKSLNSWTTALVIHNYISSHYLRKPFLSLQLVTAFILKVSTNGLALPRHVIKSKAVWSILASIPFQVPFSGFGMEGTFGRFYDGQCWTRKDMNNLKASMLGEQHFQKE